jgi:hypothetical protein
MRPVNPSGTSGHSGKSRHNRAWESRCSTASAAECLSRLFQTPSGARRNRLRKGLGPEGSGHAERGHGVASQMRSEAVDRPYPLSRCPSGSARKEMVVSGAGRSSEPAHPTSPSTGRLTASSQGGPAPQGARACMCHLESTVRAAHGVVGRREILRDQATPRARRHEDPRTGRRQVVMEREVGRSLSGEERTEQTGTANCPYGRLVRLRTRWPGFVQHQSADPVGTFACLRPSLGEVTAAWRRARPTPS